MIIKLIFVDKINKKAVEDLKPIYAKKGTIVFPKSGAAILTNNRAILGIDCYIVNHLAPIETNEKKLINKFFYFWVCNKDAGEDIRDSVILH